MEKPTKEQFGWVDSVGFDSEPSGFVIEGGEEAYEEAMKKWESLQNQNNKNDIKRSVIGLYIKYDNGDMINIQDLPKSEYEKFLESMNQLRLAYFTLISRP